MFIQIQGRNTHECDACGTATRSVKLTARERDVVALLAEALPNKEIAFRLGLTTGTVKVYVSRLLTRLGFVNRTDLAMHVLREELERTRVQLAAAQQSAAISNLNFAG